MLMKVAEDASRRKWEAVNAYNEAVLAERTPSCGPGCCACCSQQVSTALFEGFIIYQHLVAVGELERLMASIEQARVQVALFGAMGPAAIRAWGERQIPCPMLAADGTCAIYPIRPASCATFWALTPATECSPLGTVQRVDNAEIAAHVLALDAVFLRAGGWRHAGPILAPLGLALATADGWAGKRPRKPIPSYLL